MCKCVCSHVCACVYAYVHMWVSQCMCDNLSELVITHHVYFRDQSQVVSVGLIAGACISQEKRDLLGKYPTKAVRSLKESQSQNFTSEVTCPITCVPNFLKHVDSQPYPKCMG